MIYDIADKNWLKDGQAKLAGILRGDLDVLSLTDSFVEFIAEYLRAQIGAVYLAEKEGEELHLSGSNAFTKRKDLNETIRLDV